MGKVALGELPSLTIYQDKSEMYYLTVCSRTALCKIIAYTCEYRVLI